VEARLEELELMDEELLEEDRLEVLEDELLGGLLTVVVTGKLTIVVGAVIVAVFWIVPGETGARTLMVAVTNWPAATLRLQVTVPPAFEQPALAERNVVPDGRGSFTVTFGAP